MEKDIQNRETEIGQVLKKLETVTKVISENFAELVNIMQPILRNGSKEINDKPVTPEFNTSLAQRINSQVRKLDELVTRIDDVKSVIEL